MSFADGQLTIDNVKSISALEREIRMYQGSREFKLESLQNFATYREEQVAHRPTPAHSY